MGGSYYDDSSWWEVMNKTTGIHYYWNNVTNVTQYARPYCLPPPIQTTCPTCGSNIQGFQAVPQITNYSFQMHQPAISPVQFPHVPGRRMVRMPCQPSTVNPPNMGLQVNFPRKRKAGTGKEYYFDGSDMPPKPKLNNNNNNNEQDSPTSSAPVFPNMECLGGGSKNILPTEHAHVPSLTGNVSSVSKDYLYLCFDLDDGNMKWYSFKLGGGEEKIVKESGSKHELIANLLGEKPQDTYAPFIAVNSSIYRFDYRTTESSLSGRYMFTSVVHVLDIESKDDDLFAPSWKEFTPLAKAPGKPWAVPMGGKIYVLGVDLGVSTSNEIISIEVLTAPESNKWATLPLCLPKIREWFDYFVVAFEDHNKLVIGAAMDKCLYLYDVCTYHLEILDLDCLIPWGSSLPPVVVGNMLFFYSITSIYAYDLVERSYWVGDVDGLDYSFFRENCNVREDPRLVYLGGGKLCLIYFRSGIPDKNTSTVHFCLFSVPEFREQGGHRSLHGNVSSIHKFYIENTDEDELSHVLLI